MIELTLDEARRWILFCQRLLKPKSLAKGLKGAQEVIEQLSYVQIDTISVVERAHHHVLWSRLPDYKPQYLDKLIKSRKVFEYWSHAAAVLPMRDYRYSLPRKALYRQGKKHWFEQRPEHKKLRKQILDRIRVEGPLTARDFEGVKAKKSSGWWDWKPSKQVLERLFMEGYLMITERKGFQKIYDLTERVLPSDVNATLPSDYEYARHLVEIGLRAQGILRENEMYHLRPSIRHEVRKVCRDGLKTGWLELVKVHGIDKPYYLMSEQRSQLDVTLAMKIDASCLILSPFDNLVIQRKRLKELFDFDYTIECYLPEGKRKYGYFSLPVVFGTDFVARMDSKADRLKKSFVINALHFEKMNLGKHKLTKLIKKRAEDFSKYLGVEFTS